MQVLAAKVVDGRIELDGEPLPDGASVSAIVRERDGFDVDAELEAELLAALEEADRGEGISGEEMLRRLHEIRD
ncbi:MAG TPA: hypothetical protein VGR02_21235 [Thermoanaerobaculia bacterium]|jgi:hypothetical protein|nr:hypothetical protein [Thermoanaerobaculia bacterium]